MGGEGRRVRRVWVMGERVGGVKSVMVMRVMG